MQVITRLPDYVQQRLDSFVAEQRTALTDLGEDFIPLIDQITEFLQGGKRIRAQFLALGFLAVQPITVADPDADEAFTRLIDAACALEMFHAAALIHDDLIDDSDTRRGKPSIHQFFSNRHDALHYRGSAQRFGAATAILAGDLLQSWADELMHRTLDQLRAIDASRARSYFNRMRTEVAIGQYLDVLEEQLPAFAPHQEQLERSTRVLIYKSAKYSVQAPLLIGAAMAGADDSQSRSLADFGLPVGVAFQLRDDVLGVFGDAHVTGKPAGDDLTEGKRTVLVTLAREKLPQTTQRLFDELHGSADLDEAQIEMLQRTIKDTGALDRVEHMISSNIGIGREALADANLDANAIQSLLRLADFVADRHS